MSQTSSTALITGASRGLGLALARELAGQGWNLIIDARGAQALEEARAQLAALSAGGQIVAIAGDVTDAKVRVARHASKHEKMVREKRPARNRFAGV